MAPGPWLLVEPSPQTVAVGFIVLVLVALVFSALQHGPLSTLSVAPDLPLALAAWTIVGGGGRWMLVRAWLVGAARDIVDPGSLCFHAIAYTVIALLFLPVRGSIYRGRGVGWAAVAASGSLMLRFADRWWIGLEPWGHFIVGLSVAANTALAALMIGWLLNGLPRWLRPVESGEAEASTRRG